MGMKNGGISSIYGSNKILHKAWSRKGKTRKQIAKKETYIKGEKMKFHNYTIKKPIWHGGDKQRSVGIAEYRLPCLLKIDYKHPDGSLMYPNRYKITKGQAMKYPVKIIGNNIKLRIIPINDLKEIK